VDCPTGVWADTDALYYPLGAEGSARLHNDGDVTVYLPGCQEHFFERWDGAAWVIDGPVVFCEWEGYILPVAAGTVFDTSVDSPVTPGGFELDPGRWRVRFPVGYGCIEGQPMSTAECTSTQEVYTPAFEVSATPECGDPDIMARYAECSSATDADACEALGGTWAPLGLNPDPICQCPTGDGDCPCSQNSDCVTACLAPTGPGGIDDCAGLTEGTCAARPTAGCWCMFDSPGAASSICWD
jgi:hypothetical protein